MKILHFGLDSSLGGIETYLLKLATHINRDKYKFDFLVIDNDSPPVYKKELMELGCEFHSISPRRGKWLKNIKDLKKIFRENEFDIIHCHMNSLSYIAPILISLKYNKKVIVHSHNGACSSWIVSKILHKFNFYRLPKKKVKLLAVSDLAGDWMFGQSSSYSVINNGLDLLKYEFSEEARIRKRKELNISAEKKVILHTGAFRKQKNHTFLIDIFKEITLVDNDAILLLIGEGELKREIEKKVRSLNIQEKVMFLGIQHKVEEFLSASDYFLFPSLFEGFPIALVEAQTSGLTCLISDSITKEIVVEELCHPVSLTRTANFWSTVLTNKEIIDDRSGAKQKISHMGLSVEEEIEILSKIYDEVL